MDRSHPVPLGDVFAELIDRHGLNRARWLQVIGSLWRSVVGETIWAHTAIMTLTTDGVLIVGVPSSVWSQEILYYKPQILAKLQEALPEAHIRDLRTRVRNAPGPVAKPRGATLPSPYFRTSSARAHTDQDLGALLHVVQEKYEAAAAEWLAHGLRRCPRCGAPTMPDYPLCSVCEASNRPKV
jgi:hypothetical protein